MADDPQSGWWTASDGKRYPPELHPSATSPADATAEQSSAPSWGSPPPTPPPTPPSWQSPAPSAYPPPGGPGGWAPQYPAPARSTTPGLAIAALVLGVGALLFSFIPVFGWASVPFALGGVVTGGMALSRAARDGGRGMAIAGLVTAILALLVSIVWVVVFAVIGNESDDERNGFCDPDELFDPDC